ncbi:MAG: hypothetical protein HUJ54_09450 [Erysipelotrichaceae bacterium]|nr:hypothetical protein [Erysipelotrichaceae bacterium]
MLPIEEVPAQATRFNNSRLDRVSPLNPDIQNSIKQYTNLVFHLLNMGNLIGAFLYNFDAVFSRFSFKNCQIEKRYQVITPWGEPASDEIMINALTTNLLASAKSLVDYVQKVTGDPKICNNDEWNERCNEINSFRKERYSVNFYYQLGYHLRNYSQHGFLPVHIIYVDNGKHKEPVFNLNQLLASGFFTGAFKEKLREYIKFVTDEYGDVCNLTYINAVFSYSTEIIDISLKMLNLFEDFVKNSRSDVLEKLACFPEYFGEEPDQDYVFYKENENSKNIHIFNAKDTPYESINLWRNNLILRRAAMNNDAKGT